MLGRPASMAGQAYACRRGTPPCNPALSLQCIRAELVSCGGSKAGKLGCELESVAV